jgi:hypothetical protein
MMIGLEHLSHEERCSREHRLDACIRADIEDCVTLSQTDNPHNARLWDKICNHTNDWSERLALIDAQLCVLVSFGEMMISKGVFGQRHLESAASLLSEFIVFDRTEHPIHRASRARLLKDRLADISLGAGERRALRLLETRIDLELGLLEGAV